MEAFVIRVFSQSNLRTFSNLLVFPLRKYLSKRRDMEKRPASLQSRQRMDSAPPPDGSARNDGEKFRLDLTLVRMHPFMEQIK
jgi:hypothetical protein